MSTQFKLRIVLAGFTSLQLLALAPTAAGQQPLTAATEMGRRPMRIPWVPKEVHWVNPPAGFEVTRHGIEIVASEKTDMYIAPDGSYAQNNANRLLFEADRDFILSASISHPFASKWDAGALVLEGDSENWVKFCFEGDYTGAKRVVSVVTKGISDDSNSIAFSSHRTHLQIAKIGDVVFLYASETGRDWYLVRLINFKFNGKLQVGFLAQTPEGTSNRVSFTDIKYKPTAMKDFWKGE